MPVPPLPEQRAIAHILGSLDDKIELNRRMSQTLEEIARAIFKSWFVDFDPVHAKAAGRQPVGMDAETAALFPSEFEESELGLIPKGWRARRIAEDFELTMGQSPPGSTYNESGNGWPFYQGRSDFGTRFPRRRVYCSAPTRFAKPNDTLLSVRAPVGSINMASEECAIGRGVASIRHRRGFSSYTYMLMASLVPTLEQFDHEGTVFGSVNRQTLENLVVIGPPCQVLTAADQLIASLDAQTWANEQQNSGLVAIREIVLPQLVSGRLAVRSLELGSEPGG